MKDVQKQRLTATLLSALLLVLVLWPAVFMPTRSQAFAPDVVAVNTAKWVWEKIELVYRKVNNVVGRNLINNAVDTYISNLSYEMANYIASNAIGGKPLFRTEGIGKVLNKARDAAYGEFIGDLTNKYFKDLGINLCDPSLDVKLSLTLRLIDSAAPPEPKCNWRQVQQNWQQFSDNLTEGTWTDFVKFQLDTRQSGIQGVEDFFQSFSISNSDLGALLILNETKEEKARRAEEVAKITQEQCQGFQDDKTVITEEVRVHCQVVHKIAILPLEQATAADAAKLTSEKNSEVVVSLGGILQRAFDTFNKTLSGKLMEHYVQRGMWSLTSLLGNNDNNLRADLLSLLRGGADLRSTRGVDIFRDLKTVDFQQVENYSLLDDYAVCPNQADFRSPDNCTISVEFLQMLPQRKTISQAINEGLLNGDLPLIGPGDPRNNSDTCYLEGLCYHNLVKLRKAGVVPVGWEMAALRAPVGTSVTLQKAMECFEDVGCTYAADPDYDNHNPYYHLIDPYWVLKAPAARCNALVYGPMLESSASNSRQQYCADVQTCLREDGEGNCLDGQYGYCTRSENIWSFNGDICEQGDIYSGCLTFANEDSGSSSYLENSLEYCDAGQVGCQRYAQERDEDGNWLLEADMTLDPSLRQLNENDLFLNDQAANCPSDKAGCREFIVMAADRGINLLANGGFSFYKGDIDDGDEDEVRGWLSSGSLEMISGVTTANAVQVDGNITALVDTGYPLKNRSFILSFQGAGDGTVEVSINEDRASSRGISYNRELSPNGGEVLVHGTFGETANGNVINISITGANTFSVGNVKLEEVGTFSYARRDDVQASGFSNYGDGGRILMDDDRFMCTEEEVGCRGYVPLNGDPLVPGIITSEDLCPAQCVGYATFAEQPNIFDIFEGDNNPDYYNFIPTTALSCSSQDVGCEEFTNLDALDAGGEGKEYYSYLRQCVPSSFGTTYYTWEGFDVSGYQLRTVNFLESNLDSAPCTNVSPGGNTCVDQPYEEFGDNEYAVAACGPETEDPLDDPEFNLNCQEYFDVAGASHYRLSDRVVFASDDCHPYRRTFTGVEYQAIPSLSQSCQAQFAGCRAYSGAAANNQRRLFLDNFELGTYEPWYAEGGTSIDLSNEALTNNGHSMRMSSASGFTGISRPVANIQNNKSYQLSFWMKSEGTIDSVVVSFTDGTHSSLLGNIGTVPGGQWNRYEITSDRIVDLTGGVALRFGTNGTGAVYLDNFILKELVDSLSYVRNSWETPLACDSPFAGAYLGCQAYRDTNGQEYNLKSFTNLCRQESIGCMAVIDTQNSTYPFEQTFNNGDYSEITVAEDSVTYLVPDVNKYCASAYKGCSMLGQPEIDRTDDSITGFRTIYKLNNPDKYGATLCPSDNLYCQAYGSDKGIYYFKDPGNKTCSYQEDVNVEGTLIDGWFITDSLSSGDPEECAPDYELNTGWAASCPDSKNLCTTFVDPADPIGCDFDDSNDDPAVPSCNKYYYYDNDKIDETSCNGQVDQQTGCILAYDANNWNSDHSEVIKLYDTEVTYNNNVAVNKPVNPDTGGTGGAVLDANRIIRVSKDRQCAEWLACKSLTAVFNPETSQYEMVCDALDSCTEFSSTSNITQCLKWDSYTPDRPLTTLEYQSRVSGINQHLQWSDKEYTGYAIPNLFPVKDLQVYDFATTTEYNDPRLVYDSSGIAPDDICPSNGASCSVLGYAGICKDSVCWLNPTGSLVDSKSPYALTTRGYAAQDSPFPKVIRDEAGVIVQKNQYNQANVCQDGDNGCEGQFKKITYGLGSLIRYYSSEQFSAGNYARGVCSAVGDGSSKREGESCNPDFPNASECGSDGGRCESVTKIEDFINWQGICLQPDLSTNIPNDLEQTNYCNQWYPSEQILGSQSRFNHFVEAGFYNPAGQDVNMCKVVDDFALPEDRLYCGYWDNGICNILVLVPAGSKILAGSIGYLQDLVSSNPGNGATRKHWLDAGEYVLQDPNPTVGNPIVMKTANSGDKFTAADFGYTSSMTRNDLDNMVALFDADLRKFYYDEGVADNGSSVSRGTLRATNADARSVHACYSGLPDTPEEAQGRIWGNNNYCESSGKHLSYWRCSNGGMCDLGDNWDNCSAVCNPLPHNYYIQQATSTPGETIYQATSCNQPEWCLFNRNGEYRRIYNTFNIGGESPENNSFCGGDVSCQFVHCMANWQYNMERLAFTSNGYCEQYHSSQNLIYSNWDDFAHDDPAHPDGDADDDPVNIGGINCSELYFDAIRSANTVLTREAYGNGAITGGFAGRTADGCLGNATPNAAAIYAPAENYAAISIGVPCGALCYKQCSTVSVIDAEGDHDKSWVRTDIWWRAANRLNDGHMGNWNSYYFSDSDYQYVRRADVQYNEINGTTISPFFGADQGQAGDQIIVTEVPVNQSPFSTRSASTFFAYASAPTNADNSMTQLFAHLYNLNWNGTNYANASETNLLVPPSPAFSNTFAGASYVPRVLQVCGDRYCDDSGASTPSLGITVNNENGNDDIEGYDGNLFTAIKFYYQAHPDHMPIIDLKVDWGDGDISGGLPNSMYKNNLLNCDPDQNAPGLSGARRLGFAGTANACHEGYKSFFHFYVYDEDDDSNTCSALHNPANPNSAPNIFNAQCYKPIVTVTDNWEQQAVWPYGGWIVIYPSEE